MVNRFRYKALTAAGAVREGVQDGDSSAAVFAALRRQGVWPVKIAPDRAAAATGGRRFPAKVLAGFFQELALLVGADIALDRALGLLEKRHGGSAVGLAAGRLLGRVRDGGSLAQAIAAEPGFPAIAAGLVRAGEASGTLAVELGRLAEMMGRTAAIRTEIASALIYPMILLGTACLSIGVIMLFVVPEFMPLFGDAGRAPPAAFAFLMAANAVLVDWGWLGVLVLALLIVGPRFLPASDALRRRWDGVKLRLPVAGGLLRELETGRFCRTLGTLVKSGLALPAAVVMAASAVDNTAMAAALAGVASGLREGRTLVDRLIATKQLPAEACGLLKVGEESGRLADMLLRQAELSDANARTAISRLLGLMVPAITLGLGAVVAFIVTTLLVAILSVNNLATG